MPDENATLMRQAKTYGAQLRRTNGSRSYMEQHLRKSRTALNESYNEALRDGWDREDEAIKRRRK